MTKKIIVFTILICSLNAMTFNDIKQIENEYGVIEALSGYKTLAKKNDVQAMFRLAVIYSSGKDIKRNLSKSKELLERASSLNHQKATYYLGKLYLSKKSPYYDLTQAFNTFVKASNENYAPAQNMIGQFFANGIVVETDYKKAVNLFEKASKQGLVNAQCNLAFMYASGKGVFPNFGRAHQFAKKGYEEGNKKCKKVWKDYNLGKYAKDKGWKFNFYTKP